MRYQVTSQENEHTAYLALDGGQEAARFSYHIEIIEGRESGSRFWIDSLELLSGFADFEHIYAVLSFTEYKCRGEGLSAIYIKTGIKNFFYIDLLKKFGFRIIGQESLPGFRDELIYIMKWNIPAGRDEIFMHREKK